MMATRNQRLKTAMPRFPRAISAGFLAAGLAGLAAVAEPPLDTAPWDSLLQTAGLTPAGAQLGPGKWLDGGRYRLNAFQKVWDDWRLIDGTARTFSRTFLADSRHFQPLVTDAARALDLSPAPPAPSPRPPCPAAEGRQALVTALQNLHTALKQPLTAEQLQQLQVRAAAVPPPMAAVAAGLLRAVPDALAQRDQAMAGVGGPEVLARLADRALAFGLTHALDADLLTLMDAIDWNRLAAGALPLAAALDQLPADWGTDGSAPFTFSWDTPIGRVVLNGRQNDRYPAGDYLLVLDAGGDDRYATAAAATWRTPVSVVIDRAGNDRYESPAQGAIGCGCLGYSFLVDAAGDDQYAAAEAGLGTGVFGIGIVIDRGGNDHYQCRRLGQGAGVMGIGILSDLAGNDRYDCMTRAQGFGGPRGFGALIDGTGNDRYVADDTKIDSPSPQNAAHNTSLAQGCGFGRRAHPGDGHSLAGGIGLLVDGQGDDHYQAGVFGQGVAYWYALGLLVDGAGHDTYDGVWYNQGAAAHYAVAALVDLAGNDHYRATLNQSQGHGRDFSTGWLHDRNGNDTYTCAGTAQGSANMNGLGFLWDEAGNDRYDAPPDSSFGYAGDGRPEAFGLGVFLDAGGEDRFTGAAANGRAQPHTRWQQPPLPGQPLAHGVGGDR